MWNQWSRDTSCYKTRFAFSSQLWREFPVHSMWESLYTGIIHFINDLSQLSHATGESCDLGTDHGYRANGHHFREGSSSINPDHRACRWRGVAWLCFHMWVIAPRLTVLNTPSLNWMTATLYGSAIAQLCQDTRPRQWVGGGGTTFWLVTHSINAKEDIKRFNTQRSLLPLVRQEFDVRPDCHFLCNLK
jgi:hypothetical protein